MTTPETKEVMEHEVTASDTLNSIAANYDVVPSRLAAFNRLTSRHVFPGTRLKIPPPSPPPPPPPKEDPDVIDPQFVRVNVHHVTADGRGTVRGGLLLTPKVVMFDPSPNDPLVRDVESVDRFQLVAPVDLVVNFAIVKSFGGDDDDDDDDEIGSGACLRLVMGKPVGKKLPRTAPVISYGEQNLEPRYWFVVGSKAKPLLDFIRRSYPAYKCGGPIDTEEAERHGVELIREGVNVVETTCNRTNVAKLMRKTLTMSDADFAAISRTVGGPSELVDEDQRFRLAREMPARTDGCDWELKFTTSEDGFSLRSLVRKLADIGGPVVILIADCSGASFGAFLSSPPNTFSEHFQGTGETFVFTLKPEFKTYPWTGENNYFFRINADSLIVGSGDGNFALWLDADLYRGRTQTCTTFDSPLLTTEDFTLKILECWAFLT